MKDTNKDWKKRWKKIAKEDQAWDYGYLDTLVGHKLELMLEYFDSAECMCGDESRLPIVKELQEVVALYHKICDGKYCEKASDFFVTHCKMFDDNDTLSFKWDNEDNRKQYMQQVTL